MSAPAIDARRMLQERFDDGRLTSLVTTALYGAPGFMVSVETADGVKACAQGQDGNEVAQAVIVELLLKSLK